MAKDKGRDDQDQNEEPKTPESGGDSGLYGDLNFAQESEPGDGDSARRLPQENDSAEQDESEEEVPDVDRTWVPSGTPTLHGFNTEPDVVDGNQAEADDSEEDDDPDKTWGPSQTTVDGRQFPDSQQPAGSDTWVPDLTGSGDEDRTAEPDPDRTWVPDDTPTHHDFSFDSDPEGNDVSDSENADPDRTWVPSGTPTVGGIQEDAANGNLSDDDDNDEDDPNKTWVPSGSTMVGENADDIDADAGGTEDVSDDDDPNKTWVPSGEATVDGFSQTIVNDSADEDDDPNRTWVPSGESTVDGIGQSKDSDVDVPAVDGTVVMDPAGESENDLGENTVSGTVVMPRDDDAEPTENATDRTIIAPVDAAIGGTDVFSKTMGMRGLTEEEYDEWQEEVSEKSVSDTVSELDDGSDSSLGNRTQIWSKQSGAGLDMSLTIRSRPVSGDDAFEAGMKSDQPDYQIIEKLAEGGMGAVYIANQTSLQRELAIKTLKPLKRHEVRTYTSQGRISQVQKQRREMFLSEALVTANLVHPHIIPIHDLCQTADGSPFYSMKRVNGTPWNELITEMTQEENLEVLHKVCDAMAYAHHNGVVNRDLKPENIMLGEFGEVLVLDWGLAVPATPADKKRFASPSASFGAGTPAYMSPELWAGPEDAIGPWSDIYLLGAILFEAVTGKSPHEFPEPDSKAGNSGLYMIIDKVVRTNEIRKTEITGELMDIAMKAMATDPKQRHKTVLEFQDAIKGFQKHEESRRLASRADETLSEAKEHGRKRGYHDYQTAAALFEEAHTAWPENESARTGLRETRLGYATLAHSNGDYDLGLQVASQEEGEEFRELTGKLKHARRIRNGLKTAMIAAVGIIVLVGAVSFVQAVKIHRQNQEITSLYGDKETLEKEKSDAEVAKGLAEQAKKQAESDATIARNAKIQAETERLAAVQEREAAEAEKAIVEQQKVEAEKATLVAENARKEAVRDRLEAEKQKQMAIDQQLVAEKAMKEADVQRMVAVKERAAAEKQLQEVSIQVAAVEKQKVRAGVELQNAEIANLIRNADYSSALRGVDELLTALNEDQELARLPKEERQQRIQELKARKRQLLKRTVPTDVPVQTQVISPSGKTIVWGDGQGKLTVWKLPDSSDEFPETPAATVNVQEAVSSVKISTDEKLIVAASGSILHLWNPDRNTHHRIKSGGTPITTVKLADSYVLTADQSGTICSWDLNTRKERWSIRSNTGIRDLALMDQSGIFLYAGSRGGESADILAYQLPPESEPGQRPQRLGQLRLPRHANNPPRRLALSPDEQLLLISNSRNGDVIVLPRRTETDSKGRDRFPFVHAAELAETVDTSWVLAHHQRPVNDITFSSDGTRIATASDDRSIGILQMTDSGRFDLSERLEGHGARVNAAGFLDASGSRVLSASADRFCRFWDVDNYRANRKQLEDEFNLSAFRFRGRRQPPMAADNSVSQMVAPAKRWITAKAPADLVADEVPSRDDPPDYIVINADREMQRGALNSVVLSKDGRRLVTGAADGTAVIWDSETGRPVTGVSTRSRFETETGSFEEGHDFNVARLQFLPPDGKVLLTTGFDGNLCLWNANLDRAGAGRQEVRIPGLGLVNAVAASPDGKMIATSVASSEQQRSGAASIWRTSDLLNDANPEPLAVLTGFHRGEISAISFSSDGTRVVTGARDGRVAIWTADTGTMIAGGQTHAKNTIVSHLEWLADDRILSAGFDGLLAIVEPASSSSAQSLAVVTQFRHDRIPIERIAFSSDGERFASISVRTDRATQTSACELELWTIQSDTPIRRIKPAVVGGKQPRRIVAVHWSPDSSRLAAVVDGNLQIFSTESWKITRVLEAPGLGISDAVFAPELSGSGAPDDTDVVATFDGTAAHLWNLKDRSHIADFRPLFAVQSTELCDCESHPLLLTGDRAVRIFQADDSSDSFGQTLFKISDPHRGIVTSLKFSPRQNSSLFVSAGADGSAALWKWLPEKQETKLVRWLRREGAAIAATAWSPEGQQILLASADGRIQLTDISEPDRSACDFRISADEAVRLSGAAFSADGRFFAVSGQLAQSGQSTGWIFELTGAAQPDLHCTITGHEAGGINCIRFLPDSPYAATGGADGAAIVWNWQPLRAAEDTLKAYEAYQLMPDNKAVAHRAPINSLTVSGTGRIATASDDGTAIVWRNPFTE